MVFFPNVNRQWINRQMSFFPMQIDNSLGILTDPYSHNHSRRPRRHTRTQRETVSVFPLAAPPFGSSDVRVTSSHHSGSPRIRPRVLSPSGFFRFSLSCPLSLFSVSFLLVLFFPLSYLSILCFASFVLSLLFNRHHLLLLLYLFFFSLSPLSLSSSSSLYNRLFI